MQINNNSVTTRHAHPGVLEKVALEVFFVQNGTLTDPYSISGVGIFALSSNGSPSSVLGTDNLIASNVTPLMWFQNSSLVTSDASFSASTYTPGTNASGIIRLATGRYAVVLDGTVALSSVYNGVVLANTASAVGDYIDVWQVKFVQAGGYNVVINSFHLFNDNFFTITQPLLLTTRNTLNPKQVKLGGRINLKIGTEVTVGNKDLDPALRNVFRTSTIQNPQIKIIKINQGTHQLAGHVVVSSFAATSSLIDITSDNTLVFNFNTDSLFTHPEVLAGSFDSVLGTYAVQVKYTILSEEFLSPLLYFEIL